MRIGVYASCRNEIANLDDWLDSVKEADVIVMNDTGSTDGTYDLLCRKTWLSNLRVSQLPVEPMLLQNALNVAMAQLPNDIDLAIRLDLDERLPDGWYDELKKVWERVGYLPTTEENPAYLFRAWFNHLGIVYQHTRIHSRHGFHWELPVHEVLVADVPIVEVSTDITIEHHQDLTKDRSMVLGELEAAVADDPTNMRMVHYLAREYTYYGRWQDAIGWLRQHVASDAFPEERSESWRLLGDCYSALMPIEWVPLTPYFSARDVCPGRREGWVALADYLHKRGYWGECLYAAQHALTITEKSWYFNHPWAWGARPYDLAALASWFLGRKEDAIMYGAEAVRLDPADQRLHDNLAWYREDGHA